MAILLIRILTIDGLAVDARLTTAYVLATIASEGGLTVALTIDDRVLPTIMRAIHDLLKPGVVVIPPIEDSKEMLGWASANMPRPNLRIYTTVLQLAAELVTAAPSLQAFDAAAIETGLGPRVLEAAMRQIKATRSPIEEDRSLAALGTVACVRVLTTLCRPEQADRTIYANMIGSGTVELLVSALISSAFVGNDPSIRAPPGALSS